VIVATILHNKDGLSVGFTVKCHGVPIVCAAVSMLAINTINSMDKLLGLTEQDYYCKWNDEGGFIGFALRRASLRTTGAGLLLDALVLGLSDVSERYPQDIRFECKPI